MPGRHLPGPVEHQPRIRMEEDAGSRSTDSARATSESTTKGPEEVEDEGTREDDLDRTGPDTWTTEMRGYDTWTTTLGHQRPYAALCA